MKELPVGWRWVPVERLAEPHRSGVVIGPFGSNLKVSDYRDSGVPLVFVRNIRARDFGGERRFVSPTKAAELAGHQAVNGDVLITKMGDPPGDAAVYRGADPAVITADCIRVRPSEEVLPEYLAYSLEASAVRDQVRSVTRGVAQKKVSLDRFRTGVYIPLPNLVEQRRIVEILEDHLSRLDAADVDLASTQDRLVSLHESMLRSELTGGRERPGSGSAQLACVGFEDGSLPAMPPGWHWRRLYQVADVVGGVTKDAKRQSDPASVDVPYLRVANVQRGRLDLSTVTSIRVPHATAERLRLMAGDVLLNEGGDRDKLGRGWVWQGEIQPCIHQNHVFRARVRHSQLNPYLLSWAANSFGGKWCQRNGRQSVNLASISLSKIKMMPVPVPPLDTQEAVVGRIREVTDASLRLECAVMATRQRGSLLRRSLLASAFSGQLTR